MKKVPKIGTLFFCSLFGFPQQTKFVAIKGSKGNYFPWWEFEGETLKP